MPLKHLVAIATGGPGDGPALNLACRLAGRHGGLVEVIPLHPDGAGDLISLGLTLGAPLSREASDELAGAERELHLRIEAAARAAAGEAGVAFGAGGNAPRLRVRPDSLRPAQPVSRITALADLVVFGQAQLEQFPGRDLFDQCLLGDRSPVLIARQDAAALSGPAAIAWDGSAQAGRAVRAALPLLAAASEIHVLQCLTGLDQTASSPDIDALNAWLGLHGVGPGGSVRVEGVDAGPALMAAARGRSAQLLVAGAWGHSRLREAVFGGATRTFLQCRDGPNLLLAH